MKIEKSSVGGVRYVLFVCLVVSGLVQEYTRTSRTKRGSCHAVSIMKAASERTHDERTWWESVQLGH